MKAFNKIGFHTGPGGNPSGIGDWMRRLDDAGIPFMIKSVDSYGPVFEASEIAKKSGVDHTLVYRVSTVGQGHEYDYDVPPYKDPKYANDPEGAAIKHWQRTLAKLPPEFDKKRTWIEPINEVDKNLCDWLGHFGVAIANLAHEQGYKVSLFAWSSGEPEPRGWETNGMLAYLRLCAERPQQAAVALHEYSYEVDDIEDGMPYKIGRFQFLFDVCDEHNIPRPTVHITEWGWTLNNVPSPQRAIKDIREIGELYARFPEIKGAAIWYLGPGFGGIADKAQRLIKPVTDFTLQHTFDVPAGRVGKLTIPASVPSEQPVDNPDIEPPHREVEPEPQPEPEPEPEPEPQPDPQPNAAFLADVTIPDDSRLPVQSTFVKTWRVKNTGNVVWGSDYKLVHVDGRAMTTVTTRDLPRLEPGQEGTISIEFTAPPVPETYFSDWRFQDPQGNLFGDILFTRIEAVAKGHSGGVYVADVTIPDDVKIAPGTTFTKTWRVRNTGKRPWSLGFSLVFEKGEPMTDVLKHPLPALEPGQEGEISITQTAPTAPGTYFGDWRFQDDQGEIFGEILYLRIVVK